MRVRVVQTGTANKSDAVPALGMDRNALHVSNKTIPELDISFFFPLHIAPELILTTPQKHIVRAEGVKLGIFKHLLRP